MTPYTNLLSIIDAYISHEMITRDFISLFESSYYEGGAENNIPKDKVDAIELIIEKAALTVFDPKILVESKAYITESDLFAFVTSQRAVL